MEEWKLFWKNQRPQMLTENNEPTSFSLKLIRILKKLVKEKQTDEEIIAWFKVIPDEYWSRTEDNEFHICALIDNEHIIRYLISEGYSGLNHRNNYWDTPLSLATTFGNAKTVRALLDSRVIPDSSYYKGNYGPLHIASGKGFSGIIRMLIDAGANVNAVDSRNYSPLQRLVSSPITSDVNKNSQLASGAKHLIDAGARINVVDKSSRCLLHFAIRFLHYEAASVLLDAGVDVNVADNSMQTPVHFMAQQKGRESLLKRLIYAGADVNAVDSKGNTPLCYAIVSGNIAAARILVDSGALMSYTSNPISNCKPS